MHRSTALRFLFALLFVSWTAPVLGAPRDNAANGKIDEAINSYYLATEFDRAEDVLVGTLEACEDRCSPQVKARAWMYVGIVRGSGKQNIQGAQEAFQQALALDPNVHLDEALATPAVKDAFAAAAAVLGQAIAATPTAPAPSSSEGVVVSGGDVEGGMTCSLQVAEVETRRPIPVSCTSQAPATKVSLRYKVFGGEEWLTVPMVKRAAGWQGEIPCKDTGISGALRFFIQGQDKAGDLVDNYGTKANPVTINLVNQSSAPPPTYPGQPAPERCMDVGACPEDMIGTPACPGTERQGKTRGNKGWGATCEDSWECDVALLCLEGDTGKTCDTAPSCEGDSDCPSGSVCKVGVCDVPDEPKGAGGPFKRHWISLEGALDIAFIGGLDVCSRESQEQGLFSCYYSDGSQYPGYAQQGKAGKISNGGLLGTARILASYEFAFSPNLGLGARVGFAFNGGPGSFMPVHAELRGRYWFGKNALGKKGFRPYIAIGGGLAQVDAGLTVKVADCGEEVSACRTDPNLPPKDYVDLDAVKKLGQGFAAVGAGAMYAIAPNHGLVLNLSFMYMFPSTGAVLEPSIGYVIGL